MLGRLKFSKPAPDDEVQLYPRKGCKRCYGRGIVGTRDGEPVICQCCFRKSAKERMKDEAWERAVREKGSGK